METIKEQYTEAAQKVVDAYFAERKAGKYPIGPLSFRIVEVTYWPTLEEWVITLDVPEETNANTKKEV